MHWNYHGTIYIYAHHYYQLLVFQINLIINQFDFITKVSTKFLEIAIFQSDYSNDFFFTFFVWEPQTVKPLVMDLQKS